MTRGADAERAAIIRYWHTVEMFSPPSVDKVGRVRRVFQARPDRPLPWEEGHELQRVRLKPDQSWRHIVYLGIYSLENVFDVLSRVFAVDEDSYNERPSGESALAAFVVTEDGRPIVGSEVLSSCAWATGRTIHPGPRSPEWLWGFDNARTEFSADFEDLMTSDVDDPEVERLRLRGHQVGPPIGLDELVACRGIAASVTATGAALPHSEIRIKSLQVAKRKAYEADGHDFLNSFIADDLDRVVSRIKPRPVRSAPPYGNTCGRIRRWTCNGGSMSGKISALCSAVRRPPLYRSAGGLPPRNIRSHSGSNWRSTARNNSLPVETPFSP